MIIKEKKRGKREREKRKKLILKGNYKIIMDFKCYTFLTGGVNF